MLVEMTNEQKNELNGASSLEEVKEILCVTEDDDKAFIEEAERVWKEIEEHRGEDDKELDVDELEAVSGGADRNWATDGCAATCENGSWCSSNDYCVFVSVTYDYFQDPCMGNHNYVKTGEIVREPRNGKARSHTYEISRCSKCGSVIKSFYQGELP